MPNQDNPHGFRPLGRSLTGGPCQVQSYTKDASASAIFRQDLVKREADSFIAPGATAGTDIYSGVSLNYAPSGSISEHLCITSPDALFEAQGDNDTALDEADMGLNANATFAAGSTSTGVSAAEIDASTKATTSTLDLRMLRRLAVPDNEYGTFARIEIVINKHRDVPGVAGV